MGRRAKTPPADWRGASVTTVKDDKGENGMGNRYNHLTLTDRLQIEKMRRHGMGVRAIAEILEFSPSTISRELKRGACIRLNSDLTTKMDYSPQKAHDKYKTNLKDKGGPLKIGNDHRLAAYIERRIIEDNYSPAAVLGEILTSKTLKFSVTICRATLYSYIDKGVFLRLTNKNLTYKGKRKRKYRNIRPARAPKGESIERRPEEINTRTTFGNWEMDTVVGTKGSRRCLLVLTERLTRHEITCLLPDHTAASVVKAMDGLERKYGRMFRKVFRTITTDNGSEFQDCVGLERSVYGGKRTKCYYCHPYSSWEKGSTEKQNQMIRRKFPKGTNFDKVSKKEVAEATEWLNGYPRLIFGWYNSNTLFEREMKAI